MARIMGNDINAALAAGVPLDQVQAVTIRSTSAVTGSERQLLQAFSPGQRCVGREVGCMLTALCAAYALHVNDTERAAFEKHILVRSICEACIADRAVCACMCASEWQMHQSGTGTHLRAASPLSGQLVVVTGAR